jgi:hypothetical protein
MGADAITLQSDIAANGALGQGLRLFCGGCAHRWRAAFGAP